MPIYKVAHIREQGVDLIIIPLESSFGAKPRSGQRAIVEELQLRASSSGLAGTVVPAWKDVTGRPQFIAPNNWHAFFSSITYEWVLANINREISW